MRKNKLITYFFSFLFFFINSYAFSIENKIIVKINNDIITSLELKNKIRTILILADQKISQKNINKTKPVALNSLINLKLKKADIEKYKIDVTETEVYTHLSKISKNDLNSFKTKFQINNLNFDLFENEIKTELGWRKLVFNLYNNKIEINEDEINKQVNKIKNSQSNIIEYRISEISISFSGEIEKKNKIAETQEQIKLDNFENTAVKFSEASTSNQKGDLGWINSESLSKRILKILQNMQIGEISEPLIDLNNILFLKLVDKKNTKLNQENEKKLKNNLVDAKKNELFSLYSRSHLSKLKNTALIE